MAVLLSIVSATRCCAQTRVGEVDVFMGADLRYRDIYLENSLFETLVCVTPGVRWCFAPGWDVAAQLFVPVYNDYGKEFSKVRLNVASVAKQMRLGRKFAVKGSAGFFSQDRYGVDFKGMFMATPWLAFEAQAGLTGYSRVTAFGWQMSPMERLTGLVGGSIFIAPASVQMRGRIGRYAYGDWGFDGEAMRHFKHTTVALRGRWNKDMGLMFGFNVTVMLPPYNRSRKKVRIRPASSVELNYTNRSDYFTHVRYATDPEENIRQGWFTPEVAPWGLNALRPDFNYVEKEGEKKKDEHRTDAASNGLPAASQSLTSNLAPKP